MKYYAGIGPRRTPGSVQAIMTQFAKMLSPTGWCLRSGYANGADRAFGRGAVHQHIFLPWEGFNGGYSNGIDKGFLEPSERQFEIAIQHHPAWESCSPEAKLLLVRNVPILLGETLDDPVEMVVTWLPEDNYQGGTRHALRIASTWGIPVFDIRKTQDQADLCQFILNAENRASGRRQAA